MRGSGNGGRGRLTRISVVVAAVAVMAGTVALAATGPRRAPDLPRAQARATGALTMSNSRDSRAIFRATDLAPGGFATGTVTITNTGSVPGKLTLSQTIARPSDAHGRALLGALRLRIADLTAGSDVYDGRLADLPALHLSTLSAGGARTFRFSATLPDAGASDNQFQLRSVSASLFMDADAGGRTYPERCRAANRQAVHQAPERQRASQPADRPPRRGSDLRQGRCGPDPRPRRRRLPVGRNRQRSRPGRDRRRSPARRHR